MQEFYSYRTTHVEVTVESRFAGSKVPYALSYIPGLAPKMICVNWSNGIIVSRASPPFLLLSTSVYLRVL